MEQRPNILFICTDQQRFDTLGCNGNNVVQTPALDRLAASGVNFENSFVQCPMCMPSRAAIMTGRYPSANRARWNGVGLPEHEKTITRCLQDSGYHTALFGKLHLLPHAARKRSDPTFGFDTAELAEHPRPHWASAYRDWLKEEFPQFDAEDRLRTYDEELQVWVPRRPAEAHFSTWVGNGTVRYLESAPKEPFFAMMSFYDPHHPFDPPEPYASMYDPQDVPPPLWRDGELDDKPPHFLDGHLGRVNPIVGFDESDIPGGPSTPQPDLSRVPEELWRRLVTHYYGMVSLIDKQVERALAALRESELDRRTVVVFASDHGELLGDHGLLFKGPHHYDCVLRVPTIISWPEEIEGGRRFDGLVETMDLAPTILELAGVPVPEGMQAQSLAPILRGEVVNRREAVLVERNDLYWRLNMKTYRTEEWKLTYYGGRSFGELYDLKNDPNEFVNLWDDSGYERMRQELIVALLDTLLRTEDTLPPQTAVT